MSLSKLSMAELTAKLQNNEISIDEFQKALEDQKQERGNKGIGSIKVSDKGALSVKLNSQVKFPTTLYAFQWVQMMENVGQIVDAIFDKKDKLSFKDGQSLPTREQLVANIIQSLQEKVEAKKAA